MGTWVGVLRIPSWLFWKQYLQILFLLRSKKWNIQPFSPSLTLPYRDSTSSCVSGINPCIPTSCFIREIFSPAPEKIIIHAVCMKLVLPEIVDYFFSQFSIWSHIWTTFLTERIGLTIAFVLVRIQCFYLLSKFFKIYMFVCGIYITHINNTINVHYKHYMYR